MDSARVACSMVNVMLGPTMLRLTPRFCASCVNWASAVWGDRGGEESTSMRPATAQEGDWVLESDFCMEGSIVLGSTRNGNSKRLFVEQPRNTPNATIIISGGKLMSTNSDSLEPVIFVADGVNLYLQVRKQLLPFCFCPVFKSCRHLPVIL